MQKSSRIDSLEKHFNAENDTIERLRSNKNKSFLSERLRDNLEKKVRAVLLNICHEVEKNQLTQLNIRQDGVVHVGIKSKSSGNRLSACEQKKTPKQGSCVCASFEH